MVPAGRRADRQLQPAGRDAGVAGHDAPDDPELLRNRFFVREHGKQPVILSAGEHPSHTGVEGAVPVRAGRRAGGVQGFGGRTDGVEIRLERPV